MTILTLLAKKRISCTVNESDSELLEFPGIKMKSAGCQSLAEEDDETEIDQRELETDEE